MVVEAQIVVRGHLSLESLFSCLVMRPLFKVLSHLSFLIGNISSISLSLLKELRLEHHLDVNAGW